MDLKFYKHVSANFEGILKAILSKLFILPKNYVSLGEFQVKKTMSYKLKISYT